MGEIVHRIDAPVVACTLVMGPLDPVNQRVTHVHVGVPHVNFSPEDTMTIRVDTTAHFREQL